MKFFLVLVLAGVTAAAVLPAEDKYANGKRYYHETIGIKEAARIKAAEEATDFSGDRIVGGSNAALGQFPYMGGLLIRINLIVTSVTSVCGASMLTNTRAVTAASCWWDGLLRGSELTVVYGSLTIFTGGTRINTSDVVMHPDWDPDFPLHNVAVITHEHVRYTLDIHPVAMASGNNLYENARAQAIGFGRQEDNAGISSNQQLHYVYLQVISNEKCAEDSSVSSLSESIICTSGYGGRSVCHRDHGGPLVADRRLIGIVSYVDRLFCEQGHPQLYSRVSSYSSWIAGRL
ncbi:collagenase-like [Hyposmocoma kahamanoa]|uniref:collagenase-like n=1 Tax=Hyposmocoma kahamanoa TaxID=1477025 RepID=UPI000E6D9022|nr:collagenase-like [Hyposmocoma kahamanoa]